MKFYVLTVTCPNVATGTEVRVYSDKKRSSAAYKEAVRDVRSFGYDGLVRLELMDGGVIDDETGSVKMTLLDEFQSSDDD